MRRFNYENALRKGGMVRETEKGVCTRQFEGFGLDVILFFELVAHSLRGLGREKFSIKSNVFRGLSRLLL